jgi:aryl carrier-like protein
VTEAWSRGRRFMNGYGPTEVTIGAARAFDPSPSERPPIGRPLPNTQVLVLDRQGVPAPVGVPGELCVAGIGLGRGYLGRPDLTAERFAPNPWSGGSGARLYRTGDLGRWLPTGELDFVGRIDHQVKIRGFRVELGEVEAALALQPGVREAAVVAKGGGSGGLRLVAYVAVEELPETPTTKVAELRAALRAELPEFMVPAGWVVLEALPKTGSGKIDRNALPDSEDSFTSSYSPPRDDLEQLLAAIWGEELGVERVGIDDNIFDLGGHSLLMIRLQARFVDLGFEVSVTDLFQYPNVKALAGFLGRNLLTSSSEEGQDRGESRRKRAAGREDQRERRRSARRDERAT